MSAIGHPVPTVRKPLDQITAANFKAYVRDQTVNQASKLKQSRRTDPRETLRRRFNGQLQLDPGEH